MNWAVWIVAGCVLAAACGNTPASVDAGIPHPTTTYQDADLGPPYLWSCPATVQLLPAGTAPDPNFDPVPGDARCENHRIGCSYVAFIPCADDAGTGWTYETSCLCVERRSCDTVYWRPDYCVRPPVRECPTEMVTYRASQPPPELPSGPCELQATCSMKTRELCVDGASGITTEYGCGCYLSSALGVWQCKASWSTAARCTSSGSSAPVTAPVAGGDDFWIRVEGDGPAYELRAEPVFFNPLACDADATLTGCYGEQIAPCLALNVTPGNDGHYNDRYGDEWKLTSTSIEPAPGQSDIGGPIAEGVVKADAVGPGGAVLHLVFTFRAKYSSVIC